jgi:hypothetical protein
MSEHTTSIAHDDVAVQVGSAGRGFETPEGLRTLLNRLNESGPGSWRAAREAAELRRYAAFRYRRLARKYEMDAWEVASTAFEVMLARSTRTARNPWAVVTRAVQITCKAEIRAAGLLMATSRVRHTNRIAGFHDAVRFAERENLVDYHPAFAVNPNTDDAAPSLVDRRVAAVLSETVGLFVSAGWDAALVTDCVEHVAYRLGDLASRTTAMESLRRDRSVPLLLGVPPRSWAALLRIVLGNPSPKHIGTPTGDGVLLRLLSGEPPCCLRDDLDLNSAIRTAAPNAQSKP